MGSLDYKRKIIDYFKKNLTKGYPVESLKRALIDQGYSRAIIEVSLDKANEELAKKAPVLKEKPIIKYEIIDEQNRPIQIKRPWWKRIFGLA